MASLPERKYVTLVSREGYKYVIKSECAAVSNVIRDMLKSESYKEAREGVCKLQDIRAPILEKTCQYFYYKLQYNNAPAKSIPEFHIPPELALELLRASNFLDT
eukprot:jgi/Botrbrau1/2783/Bobra.0164s0060.1